MRGEEDGQVKKTDRSLSVRLVMEQKIITFRCPKELVDRVDVLADALNMTRSALVVDMIRIFCRQVRNRKGRVVPGYTAGSLRKCAPLPEWLVECRPQLQKRTARPGDAADSSDASE